MSMKRERTSTGAHSAIQDTGVSSLDLQHAAFLAHTARLTPEHAQRQHLLLDNLPFIAWLKDASSRFLLVNDAFANAFGLTSPSEAVGKTDFDLSPQAVAQGYRAADLEVLAARKPMTIEERILDHGELRWFETYKTPVLDEHGELIGTAGFARDITARKEAEANLLHINDSLEEQVVVRTAEAETRARELLESERFFHATIDALPAILCVLDEHGRIIAVNRAWRDFAAANGGNAETLCEGVSYLKVCDEAAAMEQEVAHTVASAIRSILAGRQQHFMYEYECSSLVRTRWFTMSMTRFPGDGPTRLVVMHDEITERRRLAEAHRESAERLKRLAAHLESVREEQSATIAREVHDELGGTLTMLKLALTTLVDDVAPLAPMRPRIEGMLDQVNSALQTVKRISANLRPGILDTLGLTATIRWYAGQFARMTGIAVEVRIPEHVTLPSESSTVVFRIIQEGLTNIAKHSAATRARITLTLRKTELVLRLSDNGVGLAENSLSKQDSFGVIGMLERACHLGGQLSLTAPLGKGAVLTLRLPLESGNHTDRGARHPW